MTTPTLSPVAALRRAVLLDPISDDARLVLADALDESGGEMERKWAELIRGQCARAYYGSPVTPHESALLRELVPWLRRGERCGRCKGKGMMRKRATRLGGEEHRCLDCHGIGWLGSLAEQCGRCRGKGHWQTGPHGEDCRACSGTGWLIPATITRGLVSRVELTVGQVQDADFQARLFSEWPVTEAGLVGREPRSFQPDEWYWWDMGRVPVLGTSEEIPSEVFAAMMGGSTNEHMRYRMLPTAEAANAALSAAVVSLGRAAAGLPQIGEAP